MTYPKHLVYMGSDPESILALVHRDAVDDDVTVSVVQTTAAAIEHVGGPRTACLVVDDTLEDPDLQSVIDRLADAVPETAIVVRITGDEEPTIDAALDAGLLRSDATSATRWQQLVEQIDSQPAAEGDADPTEGTHRLTGSLADTSSVIDTVLDSIVDIFFVVDLDLNVTFWNDRFNEVTGYSDEEIASMTALQFIAEDHHDCARDGIAEAIETGEATAEFALRTRDGTEIPYSVTGSLIQDDDAGRYIAGIGRDITERRTRERELTRSNAELERFAYVASHDLKEPLRMVSNYLGLLERRYRDELDDDAQDFIDYATDGAERMRGLIDGLLTYSRIQRHDDPFEPVDLSAVIETVRSNLHIAITETDAILTVDSLPTVIGDRNHLVQLFQNLLSNALTYCDADAPRIDVSVEQRGDVYQFAVADNGPGIAVDDTDRVFEIFYSGDESDSTGIGLAICKKIVENHGGRIWAESTVGDGTTVSFTLPTEEADPPQVGPTVSCPGN